MPSEKPYHPERGPCQQCATETDRWHDERQDWYCLECRLVDLPDCPRCEGRADIADPSDADWKGDDTGGYFIPVTIPCPDCAGTGAKGGKELVES